MLQRTRLSHLAGVCLLALFLCPLFGSEPTTTKTSDIETLYATLDSKTGQMRPMTLAECKAAGLPDLLSRDSSKLKMEKSASGAQAYSLQGGFQNAVLIRRNADGTFSQTCVDSIEAANAFFKGSAQSQTGELHDR